MDRLIKKILIFELAHLFSIKSIYKHYWIVIMMYKSTNKCSLVVHISRLAKWSLVDISRGPLFTRLCLASTLRGLTLVTVLTTNNKSTTKPHNHTPTTSVLQRTDSQTETKHCRLRRHRTSMPTRAAGDTGPWRQVTQSQRDRWHEPSNDEADCSESDVEGRYDLRRSNETLISSAKVFNALVTRVAVCRPSPPLPPLSDSW